MEKEYEATLDADLPPDAAQTFAAGTLMLKDEGKRDHEKPCKPAKRNSGNFLPTRPNT